jgi:hypothetical protein
MYSWRLEGIGNIPPLLVWAKYSIVQNCYKIIAALCFIHPGFFQPCPTLRPLQLPGVHWHKWL